MILNEDYFDDLKIEDEDITADDVEKPNHDLTVEELHKLPDQYNQVIDFQIDVEVSMDMNITFIQTSLIPKLFKGLDAILELYDIEHSLYVLSTEYSLSKCDTIVEFGDYQLFCREDLKDNLDEYFIEHYFNIHVFVNYPKFNYKRAFRFVYTVLNLYRNCKQSGWMNLITTDYDIQLAFWVESNYIDFHYYNTKTTGNYLNLCKELTEEDKRAFYRAVFRHFFGEKVKLINYKAIDRDVPLKHIRPR